MSAGFKLGPWGEKEVILAFVVAVVLGWVVGVMCCVAVVKYLQCMAGKTLVFGPHRRTQPRESRDAVTNPTYKLNQREMSNEATPKLQCTESGYSQSNSRLVYDYTDVQKSSEVPKSNRGDRRAPGSRQAAMSSSTSLSKSSLQQSMIQSGRTANAYSKLDKASYSVLQPHIQDKGFSFKESVGRIENYNMLDY